MSTLLRTTSRGDVSAPERSVPALARVLLRASLRESSRDRGLIALALGTPVVALLLLLLLQGVVAGTHWRVQVGGSGPDTDRVVAALRADGEEVTRIDGVLAAPGPEVDATVVVGDGGVLVRVATGSVLAVADLRADLGRALPGREVRVLGPAGRDLHDVGGYLLPGAVALTAVVLAFPGTAGRVAGWRRRGTLDLLTGAGGLRGPYGWALLAPVLVPSRMLLGLPAVAVALVGCALTGDLDVGPAGCGLLVVTFLLGSAVCTGLGVLGGFVLRSEGEVRAASWAVVVLTGVFGGVLLPLAGVPPAAAAVLRWSPTSVFADGWRWGLTGAAGEPVSSLVVPLVVVVALGALVVAFARIQLRGPRSRRP